MGLARLARLTWLTWGSVLLASASAAAFTLNEDPLEGRSVELGVTVRSFSFALLHMPAGVGSTRGGLNLTALRIAARLESPTLQLVLHHESELMTTSVPELAAGLLRFGQGGRARTWLPLESAPLDESGTRMSQRVDWAYVRYSTGRASITIGRQPLSFGRALIWSPLDLPSAPSPVQIDSEFKSGVDALRSDLRLGAGVELVLLTMLGRTDGSGSLEPTKNASAALGRLDVALGAVSVGTAAGVVRGDGVLGADVFADVGRGFDVHAEAVVVYPTDESSARQSPFLRAVVGATGSLSSSLTTTLEAHWDAAGAWRPAAYARVAASERAASGQQYTWGRVYLGSAVEWQPHVLLQIEGVLLVNLRDPSALLAPQLRYSVATNAVLLAGAYLPLGASPRVDAEGALTPRSEFGLYPSACHLDMKLYF